MSADKIVTQTELDVALAKQSKAIVSEVSEIIGVFATQIDERFNKLETRMDEFDQKLDKLTNTIDGFIGRIEYMKPNKQLAMPV